MSSLFQLGLRLAISRWVVWAWLAFLAGCSGSEQLNQRIAIMQQCAEATAAKQSSLPALRAALAEVERQGGLPAQLERTPLPDDRNAATAIAPALNDPLRTALLKPLADLTGRPRFVFSTEDLTYTFRLIERHKKRVEQFRAAVQLPTAQFPIAPQLGYFANVTYLDNAAIACRFELAEAALALGTTPMGDAATPLERAARWIGWLAREPRLEPRLLAARLRREWLTAVEAVAKHPSVALADYERLRGVLVDWLAEWPDPVAVMHGERAATLHAYEAIRHGLFEQITSGDEWARLEKYGITPQTPLPAEAIDQDLAAYLKVMDRVATLVRQPFHQRYEQHKNVATLLDAAEANDGRAPLATEMFLPGLPSSLERLAIDRASCEAWTLALSAAGGFRLPEQRINPRNGELYQVERLPRSLIVQTADAAIRNPFALRRTE